MSHLTLVTGGTRGIGEAISMEMKEAGYNVVASYAGNDAAAKAFNERTGIPTYKFDVSDFEQCQSFVKQIENDNGGPIEILINNAAVTRDTTFHKMALDQWQDVIQTNLGSCFNMCRSVIEGMRARGFGRIVNIGSLNGQAGQVGQSNYAASNAGLVGFRRALALENAAKGVTVNVVSPGYTDTEMLRAVPEKIRQRLIANIPMGRLGMPHDVARSVLYLVGDDADWITGATLSVNGGQRMA